MPYNWSHNVQSYIIADPLCYANILNWSSALEDAGRSVDIDFDCIEGHIQFAKCHVALGDALMAEKAINTALKLDPENTKAMEVLSEVKRLVYFEANLKITLERGKRFMNIEMYEEAMNDLERAAQKDDAVRTHPNFQKLLKEAKSKLDVIPIE